MADKDVFINNFEEALQCIGNKEDKAAKEVIESVAHYSERAMEGEKFINYFFADHGWKHSTRLSEHALFMIKQLKKDSVKQFEAEKWNDMLVLLWTAIALHDIGMNDIKKDLENKDIIDIITKQNGRDDHVKKSGEWISKIIELMEEMVGVDENIRDFINAWEKYWSAGKSIDTIAALRIVKDITLMHGEKDNFLVKDKIGTLDRDVFGDIDENDIYKKIISYDEAILCLIDLLDICSERMYIFDNEGLNEISKRLDKEKIYTTFEHWVSHNITTIKFDGYDKDGYVRLDMCKYSMENKMYLNNPLNNVYPELGAVKACIEWGNNKNLINILEKDFGYKGVKVNLITSNATKWRNIRKRAKELELYKNEQIMKINSQLGGVKNWFVNDLVSRWAKKWSVKNLECFQEISPVLEIVQEGAALHLLYEKVSGKSSEESVAFSVRLLCENGMIYDKMDYILIAINALFELCKNRINIKKIQFISKGNSKFASLLNGTDEDKETAYIIIVENYYEDNWDKIIDTIKRKADGSFVIFACTTDAFKNNKCQEIKYRAEENYLVKIKKLLDKYVLNCWLEGKNPNQKEIERVNKLIANNSEGIGKYLKELKFIYNGIQAIEERIVEDLKNDQYDSLFILNLFEMMSKPNENSEKESREIEREELVYFYNNFCKQNRSKIYNMREFEHAIDTLLNLCEESDGKIMLLEKYEDSSYKSLISNLNKETENYIKKDLFQMLIFFWLYNYRKVNFKSICYREYLTYLSPNELCGYILNSNILLDERINIAFETGEIIADRLKLDTNDKMFKQFVDRYIMRLLEGKGNLIENEDIICFQSIYRIMRGILKPDMQSNIDFIINIIKNSASYVGYLGVIEGICSANLIGNRELNENLNKMLEQMLEQIFKEPESNIQYMAYDILYMYDKSDLRKKYMNNSWENICASLHGKEDLKEENEGKRHLDWKEMRRKFMYILEETSSAIRKRNMFDIKVEE